jgi:hypothetical protein
MKELTEELLKDIKDNALSLTYVCKNYKIGEDLIRKYHDKVDWYYISSYQVLNENLIRDFQDKVYWNIICRGLTFLSEEFIREFKNKVDWRDISRYHKLSGEFIIEFQDNICFKKIVYQHELHDYNEDIQLFILKKLLEQEGDICYLYGFFTDYMKNQYNRLGLFL